jgi:diaminohydroxyphosphoribosylaminopyrimidine deaminase/5-amino-6-(5-phosphoribosylamino)uracil reductase
MSRPDGDASSLSAAAGSDHAFMRRALALAERGWGQTAPNPMVGAVVVAGDEVVGEGYHARYGEAHAETGALAAAAARARGATLYVTLEPCAHHGKTPPCADAVIAAGIARVVVAVRDPSVVARGGVDRLRDAGIHVDIGVARDEALELNAPFFAGNVRDRPWLTLKLALSSDGAIADPTGVHRWITGEASRLEVHRLRANSDAIAVGVGTVLADDPTLTVRDVPAPRIAPLRVVFDSDLRTPQDAALVRTARDVPTLVYAAATELPTERLARIIDAGAEVALVDGLEARLRSLAGRGVRSLFVEGGARLTGSLLRESLVDRLVIFQSSLMLGDDALKAFAFAPDGFEASLADRRVIDRRQFGEDVMTIYALEDVPCSPD